MSEFGPASTDNERSCSHEIVTDKPRPSDPAIAELTPWANTLLA